MEFVREIAFRFPLCRGEDVRAVQQALTIMQSEPPCGTVDGIYGNATKLAVMAYQRRSGLDADGVVGPKTWSALLRDAADRQSSVPPSAQAALVVSAAAAAAAAPSVAPGAAAPPADLPVTEKGARTARDWLFQNFGPIIDAAIAGTPIERELVAAIACKETANVWLHWLDRLSPEQVLARCVFDGSGDVPGTSRSAFPKNADAFRQVAGPELTDALIDEANETRKLRGLPPQRWLYKGYGIFQYDLQHFKTDPQFFQGREWGKFDACMQRFMSEIRSKLAAAQGDVPEAVRRYNGSGPKAEEYRDHVLFIRSWL